jgi:hypothetical protein
MEELQVVTIRAVSQHIMNLCCGFQGLSEFFDAGRLQHPDLSGKVGGDG